MLPIVHVARLVKQELAPGIAQDVLIAVARKLTRLSNPSLFRAWRIATHPRPFFSTFACRHLAKPPRAEGVEVSQAQWGRITCRRAVGPAARSG